jgi:hypothetical protein
MRDMEQYLKNLLNISMNLELKQKKNKVMIKIPKSLERILDTPEKIAELEKSIIAFREWAQRECPQWSEHLKKQKGK